MMRNAGVFKIDQVELTARTTHPSDSDLADARMYYSSTSAQIYGRASGVQHGMLNTIQEIRDIRGTTTLTDAHVGIIAVTNAGSGSMTLTLPAASADKGLTYSIVNRTDGQLTIKAAGTDQIDRNGVTALYGANHLHRRGDTITLVADGTGTWYTKEYNYGTNLNVNEIVDTITLSAGDDRFNSFSLVNPTDATGCGVTLPAASTAKGLTYGFINKVAKVLTISAAGTDEIDVAGTTSIADMDAAGDMIEFVSDGTGTWFIKSRYIH